MLPVPANGVCAMWCEQMQDVSGYTADAAPSPLSELATSTRTISPEYDIYSHDSGYPSPDELLQSYQDHVDPASMYNNEDCQQETYIVDNWLADPCMENFPTAAIISRSPEACDLPPQIKQETSLLANAAEKPPKPSGRLSVFATEEPRIAQTTACDFKVTIDFSVPSYNSDDYKPTFDLSETPVIVMDLGGEVEVTTEEESPTSSEDCHFDFKKEEPESDFPVDFSHELASPNHDSIDCSGSFTMDASQSPLRPVPVGLKLDIAAALAPISSAEPAASLPNTPDLMSLLDTTPDILRPTLGFDLVAFMEDDANNNAISLPSLMVEEAKPDQKRRGKPWTLADLKSREEEERGRKREWRKPKAEAEVKPRIEQRSPHIEELLAGPSRPARKSAEKFRERIEQGLLKEEVSEDEGEKEVPKKRRRSDSTTSSRSSVSGDQDKYRERRDRNNISSRLSRQKRKDRLKMKQQELKDLETQNLKLQSRCEALRRACDHANLIWQQYLESVKRERARSS